MIVSALKVVTAYLQYAQNSLQLTANIFGGMVWQFPRVVFSGKPFFWHAISLLLLPLPVSYFQGYGDDMSRSTKESGNLLDDNNNNC